MTVFEEAYQGGRKKPITLNGEPLWRCSRCRIFWYRTGMDQQKAYCLRCHRIDERFNKRARPTFIEPMAIPRLAHAVREGHVNWKALRYAIWHNTSLCSEEIDDDPWTDYDEHFYPGLGENMDVKLGHSWAQLNDWDEFGNSGGKSSLAGFTVSHEPAEKDEPISKELTPKLRKRLQELRGTTPVQDLSDWFGVSVDTIQRTLSGHLKVIPWRLLLQWEGLAEEDFEPPPERSRTGKRGPSRPLRDGRLYLTEELAARLRILRLSSGMTQEGLSRLMGRAPAFSWQVETGYIPTISVKSIEDWFLWTIEEYPPEDLVNPDQKEA